LPDDESVLRSDVICDELWAVIEPVLPCSAGRRGRPWNDHRVTLEAIVWRFRTGSPWRDLPEYFGSWQSVWERHRRWSTDGTYAAMFAAVRSRAGVADDGLLGLMSADSTSIRAHQHAAGARFHGHTGGRIESQESAR
jgi:transposase